MSGFIVRKDKDGLYTLVMRPARGTEYNRRCAAAETERAKTDAFLKSWRERGGYEGALARQQVVPIGRKAATHPRATSEHMPFLGHRKMSEIG